MKNINYYSPSSLFLALYPLTGLQGMHQFVGQKLFSLGGIGLVLAFVKIDIVLVGKGPGIESFGHFIGFFVLMYSDLGKINAITGFLVITDSCI